MIEARSSAFQADSLPSELPGKLDLSSVYKMNRAGREMDSNAMIGSYNAPLPSVNGSSRLDHWGNNRFN